MLISLGNEYSDDQGSQSTIRFWDLRSGEFVGEIQRKYEIEDLNVSFDGRLLAATCSDGLFRLWGIPLEP